MTLTIELKPDLEDRLMRAADRNGLGADEYTIRLLEEHVPGTDGRGTPRSSLKEDPLMAMVGVDDFEPVPVDESSIVDFRRYVVLGGTSQPAG